jgi:hypothetical protein
MENMRPPLIHEVGIKTGQTKINRIYTGSEARGPLMERTIRGRTKAEIQIIARRMSCNFSFSEGDSSGWSEGI